MAAPFLWNRQTGPSMRPARILPYICNGTRYGPGGSAMKQVILKEKRRQIIAALKNNPGF
jgi:hypothetical protein